MGVDTSFVKIGSEQELLAKNTFHSSATMKNVAIF